MGEYCTRRISPSTAELDADLVGFVVRTYLWRRARSECDRIAVARRRRRTIPATCIQTTAPEVKSKALDRGAG